ncbi:DinB family protein [Sporosarcina sp. PTS2304]|uniref:DinB family protein n=1 Tax=Sporosarcina sp. PTS2304 TaxID=2283194 RepID=UPI000E0D69FC|nr:DinB family protein [Sporosarcina sp. PTS2304]AXI00867.1 DinB family protein [Sporosarcina sp. PTS2304]
MGAVQQLSMARGYTLGRIKGASEEMWDVQPANFSNTIHWNVGHIYVTAESLLSQAVKTYEPHHTEWSGYFKTGTSPSAWQDAPPAMEKLIVAFKEQGKRIPQVIDHSSNQALESPISIGKFITMETIDDVLQFLAWHEGIHSGLIAGLVRVTK